MADVLAEYQEALEAKEAIEQEIQASVAELMAGMNPGLHGPLVDAEGFPRADIDVYRMRQLRHAVAVKQTDHQLTMKKIEALLPQVFDARKGHVPPVAQVAAEKTLEIKQDRQEQPFAVVASVESESPAERAGLQVQDQVLRFGSAHADNHRELSAVRDIVQRNIGSSIRVLVRRKTTQLLELELTPQTWRDGSGVLGCLLQPITFDTSNTT